MTGIWDYELSQKSGGGRSGVSSSQSRLFQLAWYAWDWMS